MSDIERLEAALKGLREDAGLRKKIKFLEREIARLQNKPAEPVQCDHEEHIELLRGRIKELEGEVQGLTQKLEKIRAKAILD